jgi:hypothetical protein
MAMLSTYNGKVGGAMPDNGKRVNDGSTVHKGVSDRNANYQPSVPANYNPPPPIKIPPPPARQSK